MRTVKMLLTAIMLITITATLSGECRLLMMIARNKDNETCDGTSHDHAFARLSAQSVQNEHDWGIAYFETYSDTTGDGIVWDYPNLTYSSNRYASYRPAYNDSNYPVVKNELRDKPTQVIIGHVRQATSGGANMANPHPFVFETGIQERRNYVFAHNGSADVQGSTYNMTNMSTFIDTQITVYGWSEQKWGPWRDHDVDSGVFFGFIMAHVKLNNWDVLRGLREALTHGYVNNTNWTARNFVFSDGYDAYAYRSYLVNPNSYTLEYAILDDSLIPVDNTTAYIMSELPDHIYYNGIKIQLDNNELVYIPRRGEPVHFKNFNSTIVHHVKDPKPPFEGATRYFTWDSFPVLADTTAIPTITQDYTGGSGIGLDSVVKVINQQGRIIERDNPNAQWNTILNPISHFNSMKGYKVEHG